MANKPESVEYLNGEFVIKDDTRSFKTKDASIALTILVHEFDLPEQAAKETIQEVMHNK